MLDVLLRRPDSSLSASEIAEIADIHESTIGRNKEVLEELDIIACDKKNGVQKYQINKSSPIVGILARAHTELIEYAPQVVGNTEVKEQEFIGQVLTNTTTTEESAGEEGNDSEILQTIVETQSQD